ncbi:MAG: diguanylate cyclase, partial [Acidaminococcaceae bacterium]
MFDINKMHTIVKEQCATNNLYELYRLVDPLTHQVYSYNEDKYTVQEENMVCYDLWKRGFPCANCISKNTCSEDKQYIKLECLEGRILIVHSLPVRIEEKIFSLELALDVTNSMLKTEKLMTTDSTYVKAIANFNELAIRDVTTGLFNKTYAINELDNLAQRLELEPIPVTVVILYLANLKEINTLLGRQKGDEALEFLVEVIKRSVRLYDGWACRLAEDELGIVFVGKQEQEVGIICKRFGRGIASHILGVREDKPVTVS